MTGELPRELGRDRRAELVREVHRMWIVAAVARIAYEAGPDAVTVNWVAVRSGLHRSTVEALFGDRDGCVEAAFEKAVAVAAQCVIPWFAAEVDAAQRIRTAASGLLAFCDTERELATLCLAEAECTAVHRRRMVATLTRVVLDELSDQGLGAPDAGAAAASVQHAIQLVRERLAARETVSDLLAPIVSAVLSPQLGPSAARREAMRSAGTTVPPAVQGQPYPRASKNSLELRLTAPLLNELSALNEDARRRRAWPHEPSGHDGI